MRLLESWMNGNVHVRFGGGLTEKCQTSYGYLVTRWLPTLQQPQRQQRVSISGVPRLSNVPEMPGGASYPRVAALPGRGGERRRDPILAEPRARTKRP
jgi:hypothetical protein